MGFTAFDSTYAIDNYRAYTVTEKERAVTGSLLLCKERRLGGCVRLYKG